MCIKQQLRALPNVTSHLHLPQHQRRTGHQMLSLHRARPLHHLPHGPATQTKLIYDGQLSGVYASISTCSHDLACLTRCLVVQAGPNSQHLQQVQRRAALALPNQNAEQPAQKRQAAWPRPRNYRGCARQDSSPPQVSHSCVTTRQPFKTVCQACLPALQLPSELGVFLVQIAQHHAH